MMSSRNLVVFVHGIFSSSKTWAHFDRLVADDPDLRTCTFRHYEYASPVLELNPLRSIPLFSTIAHGLRTFLEDAAADFERVALVTHSQGGLVAQRFLTQMLADGEGERLAKIRAVMMFACPNSGSELMLLLRRSVLAMVARNPQEKALRPLNAEVIEAQRTVLMQIVHATEVTSSTCPIPIFAYAGQSDGIVTPQSAMGLFPATGVLPGDHSTIIQPDTADHPAFRVFRRRLLESFSPAAATKLNNAAAKRSDSAHTEREAHWSRLEIDQQETLLARLLAVPQMADPGYRRLLFEYLPAEIVEQIPNYAASRPQIVGMLQTFDQFPHLEPWRCLDRGLRMLFGQSYRIHDVRVVMVEFGLLTEP